MQIKTFLLLTMILVPFTNAHAQMVAAKKNLDPMTLTVNIIGADNKNVVLSKMDDDKPIATAVVKDGKFVIKANLWPAPYKLTIGESSMFVALLNNNINITGDIANLQASKIENSYIQPELDNLLTKLAPCKTQEDRFSVMEKFAEENTHSWIALNCLYMVYRSNPNDIMRLKNMVKFLSYFESNKDYVKIRDYVNEY